MLAARACGLLRALACTPAIAAVADPVPAPEVLLPAVEVTAQRLAREQQVRTFVEGLTRRVDGEESPPLWYRRICPLAAGFNREQGEYVLSRLSQLAVTAGARLGTPGCRPNLYVILTGDPASFLAAWRVRVPQIFRGASQAEIERFVGTAKPIRAWHVVGWIGADGAAILKGDIGGAVPAAGRLPNSRIERGSVLELRSVIVVIDAGSVRGRPLGQLVDYVAMVGLAELQSERDFTGTPTILTTFGGPPDQAGGPVSLTDWDLAFLRALYGTDPESRLQRSLVTGRMLRDLGP